MKKPLVAFQNIVLGEDNLITGGAPGVGALIIVEDKNIVPPVQILPPINDGTKVSIKGSVPTAEVSKVATLAGAEVVTPNTRYSIKVIETFGDTGSQTPRTFIYATTTPDPLGAVDYAAVLAELAARINRDEDAVVTAVATATELVITDKPGYYIEPNLSRGGISDVFAIGFTIAEITVTTPGVYALGIGAVLDKLYPVYNRAVTDVESGVDRLDAVYGRPDPAKNYTKVIMTYEGNNEDHRAGEHERYPVQQVLYSDVSDLVALEEFLTALFTEFGAIDPPVPVTPPTASTSAALPIGATSATLNGSVDPADGDTTATFGWSDTMGGPYTDAVAAESPISAGAGATAVTAALTGLTTLTQYWFILTAVNSGGEDVTVEGTFTTI